MNLEPKRRGSDYVPSDLISSDNGQDTLCYQRIYGNLSAIALPRTRENRMWWNSNICGSKQRVTDLSHAHMMVLPMCKASKIRNQNSVCDIHVCIQWRLNYALDVTINIILCSISYFLFSQHRRYCYMQNTNWQFLDYERSLINVTMAYISNRCYITSGSFINTVSFWRFPLRIKYHGIYYLNSNHSPRVHFNNLD